MIAAVRSALGILGVVLLVVGTGCIRLGQHDRHVERAVTDARDARDRVELVRSASRRLYDALDRPFSVFDKVGRTKVSTVGEQVTLLREAAQGMAAARRDFLAAAGAYRDVTHSDLGSDEKRLAHADDIFIQLFLETGKMVEMVAGRPETASQFRGAMDKIDSAMHNGMSEYQRARGGIIADMRDALKLSRARVAEANRDLERLRTQPVRASLIDP